MKNRPGHTLVELLIVVTILVLTAAFVLLRTNGPDPATSVAEVARQIRLQSTDAILRAEAQGGDAVLAAASFASGDQRGAFFAAAGATDLRVDTLSEADSIILANGVRWGSGAASTGPLGDSTRTWRLPSEVRCRAGSGCNLGGASATTYFLEHRLDPYAVYALVLTEDGFLRTYRFQNGASTPWTLETP